jgi:hypothetical protein
MSDVYRRFVVKKYVWARTALEAIEVSESEPVIVVIDNVEEPEPSNPKPKSAIGLTN